MRARIWKELNILQNRGSILNLKRKHNLGGGKKVPERTKILKTTRDNVDRGGKNVCGGRLSNGLYFVTDLVAYEPQGTTP